ncbi:MAG: formimidoylglutamase [Salinimicrobium sp.]
MKELKIYDQRMISKYFSVRSGETKLGEKIGLVSGLEELKKTSAQFIIFGIPEDIGVRANYGKAGTSAAWEAFLSAFLNVQVNPYLNPENLILLGELAVSEEMHKAANIDISDPNYHQKLGDLVVKIDEKVSAVVQAIIGAGKTPVIIGGGHNNAFGNIKGASKALQRPINVINIDAHTDLRKPDYRHSGNGFSYALKNAFLKRYSVYGLHENYTPGYIFEDMRNSEDLRFVLLEDLQEDRISAFSKSLNFVKEDSFGLELDCDAIKNFPSSAVSPSGFSLDDARQLLRLAAKEKNCTYLHVCEASENAIFPTGKALSYLITDFIKTKNHD